jgi:hypothetical protein
MTLRVEAEESRAAAVAAVWDFLSSLGLGSAFVGRIAMAGWTGGRVSEGTVDVLTLLTPERSAQIPQNAAAFGFGFDREALEATAELDLIPLDFAHGASSVRVHLLMATNALYGRMIRDARDAIVGRTSAKIVAAEDLAFLLTMADDDAARDRVIEAAGGEFDTGRFNARLVAIGLPAKVIVR